MYAVIRVGGKQERVKAGDVIEVEFMHVDPGSSVEFQPILVVDDDGKPHHGSELAKSKVTAKLLGDKKGDKVKVFKYRPKSGYRRTQGHRQLLTLLEVEQVALGPGRRATEAEAQEPEAGEAAPPVEEARTAPARKPAARKPSARKPTTRKPAAKKTAAKKPADRKATPRKKPAGRKKAT